MPTPAGATWRWVTDSWSVDSYPPTTSRDGWQYAGSFAALALAWAPAPAPLRFVRRRRHVRLQQLGGSSDQPLTMLREFIARSRGSSAALFGVVPAYVAAGAVERASWGTTRLSASRLSAPVPPARPKVHAEAEPKHTVAGTPEPEPEPEPAASDPDTCHSVGPSMVPQASTIKCLQVLGAPPGFPAPNIGAHAAVMLTVAEDTQGAGFICNDKLVVTKVQLGKAADKAGLQPGMQLQSFQGVPVSTADASWASVKQLVQSTPKPWSFVFGPFAPENVKAPASAPASVGFQLSQQRGATALTKGSPPEGICLKQKPTLRTWPTRYIRIQGKSLNVFQNKGDAKARGSSIPDLTGCDITGGVETWPLQGTWYKLVVFREDLKPPVGPTAAFCFRVEAERDRFLAAVRNIAHGRPWDNDGVASDKGHSPLALEQSAGVSPRIDTRNSMLTPEPRTHSTNGHSMTPVGEQRASMADNFEWLISQHQLPTALASAPKDLGPAIRLMYPEISIPYCPDVIEAREAAVAGWVAVVDHISQPWANDGSQHRMLRELGFCRTGHQLREAFGVSAEDHRLVVQDRLKPRRRAALRALFAREAPASDVAGVLAPPMSECTVELMEYELPKKVDGSIVVRIEANIGGSVDQFSLSTLESTSWLSAPAYAKDGLAKWYARGGKFRVSGAVSSLRIFVETATSDGRSITANQRGHAEMDVTESDPLGVDPVNLTTQTVPGLSNAGNEVGVRISKADGVVVCAADSDEEWKRALFKLGLRSVTLKDNPGRIVYSHRIEVSFHFERQLMLLFTDATGDTYVLRCLSAGMKTLAFNSSDPTIKKIAACEIGLQGIKATAAALTSVSSDDLASDAEWFPGKNLLRLAKGASGILGADDLPGAIAFEGGQLKVKVTQWTRDLRPYLPEKQKMQLEFDAAKQAAEQHIKAGNRAEATTQLERAEELKQLMSSYSDRLNDGRTVSQSADDDTLKLTVELFQLIVGRSIAYYVERGSQLGAGEALFSDDDDAEDEWVDGSEAQQADEWVGLSTTVSDERVNAGDMDERGSTLFGMRKQLRMDAHKCWPLATIVPWRVYYLFVEIAIDANVSQSVLWLSQISGMLRRYNTSPVYMKALLDIWGDYQQHFGCDETPHARALEQAVLSVTSHCVLSSIRDLWQSYPQDDQSTADDYLDALQCGLRILKLLAEQTVNVENPDLSPEQKQSESHRQMTVQLEDAICEAAQEVALCLQGVRLVDYFAAPLDEESDDAEWEVIEDEHQKVAVADELRHKMQELVKNMGTVCDAIISFNDYYAQVFQAESDLPASATFTSPLYEEIWQTMRLVQKTAKPELHMEDMQSLVISCTKLNRSVAASCDIDVNDVALAIEPFVCAAIEHCGVNLSQIADAAIKVDEFQPINPAASQCYSTSVVDVLRACVQSVQPLQYLIWSSNTAVRMTKRLGQVVMWYANLVASSCKGETVQLRAAWQDGVALSTVQVAAAHVREGEVLDRLFVHMNNIFHVHQQLGQLGDKIDTLHHILQQEGPDGWHQFVEHTGQVQWDANVESWAGDRSWENISGAQHEADEDDAKLRPTMSRLNRGELTDPSAVVDIFLQQCQLKYRECVAEVVDAVGSNLHHKIVSSIADASEADPGAQMLEWIDSEVLTRADVTLHPDAFRRFVRGVHFQCFCQLEAILLGEGLKRADNDGMYADQISRVAQVCDATNTYFRDQSLGAASAKLAERIQQLVSIHQTRSSEELRSWCDQSSRQLPEHISPDDVRRLLAVRSTHDAVALGVLQEQGFTTSSVSAPKVFDVGIDEVVVGSFECWFPAGAIYICTDHLLFEPKLAFAGEAKLQVRYSEIRFLKKQKMTGIGADTCLEIGLDQDVICFRGFHAANASGQSVRDNCHALICQQSSASCGNDLESAEAGSWPELRRMFGLPANENLVKVFSCHYVVHGT